MKVDDKAVKINLIYDNVNQTRAKKLFLYNKGWLL